MARWSLPPNTRNFAAQCVRELAMPNLLPDIRSGRCALNQLLLKIWFSRCRRKPTRAVTSKESSASLCCVKPVESSAGQVNKTIWIVLHQGRFRRGIARVHRRILVGPPQCHTPYKVSRTVGMRGRGWPKAALRLPDPFPGRSGKLEKSARKQTKERRSGQHTAGGSPLATVL